MLKPVSVVSLAFLVACGTKESSDKSSSPAQPAAASSSTSGTQITLTALDIDGFEKGLRREIALVKDGHERAAKAVTAVERGNAIQSTFEENTMKEAVPVSGLSFERYHLIRGVLAKLLTTLDFQGKIDGPQSVDTTHADSAMKARLASDPYAVLDSAGASLLKSRLGEIVPIWVEYVNQTVVGG